MQLAAIQRNAAGKALVADVKAKNLEASPVDLLRIVKARCPSTSVAPTAAAPRKCAQGCGYYARPDSGLCSNCARLKMAEAATSPEVRALLAILALVHLW